VPLDEAALVVSRGRAAYMTKSIKVLHSGRPGWDYLVAGSILYRFHSKRSPRGSSIDVQTARRRSRKEVLGVGRPVSQILTARRAAEPRELPT
jgi:hypothetical protein